MTNRRDFLRTLGAAGLTAAIATDTTTLGNTPNLAPADDRTYWVSVLKRIAEPVLVNTAAKKLKERMPVESRTGRTDERRQFSHLEALGRLLAGMAPWLELQGQVSKEEAELKSRFGDLARKAIDAATDPKSPDFMNFTLGRQPLVDAAFLAHAIVRAPNELWKKLPTNTQKNLIAALKSSRPIQPYNSNWLLFSAMVEAGLSVMGEQPEISRIEHAVTQHEQWYKGDGVYGDGADFHWDYYNSFVIQPMLLDVLKTVSQSVADSDKVYQTVLKRARRYAVIQERLISPEGTFPPIGRSLAYRFGAFQLLGQIALMGELPAEIIPAQVRSALTAVIRRMIEAPNTFDANGWLTIGFYGHQPAIGEEYISTGSLYLCSVGLLPLGLPPENPFWSAPAADWTAKKIWSGQDAKNDRAI